MTYTALDSTQTTGPTFRVPRSADYDCFLSGHVSGSTVAIQRYVGEDGSGNEVWVNMDTASETVATWTSDGGGLVPFVPGGRYRVLVTGNAGATMTVDGPSEGDWKARDPVDA